MSSRTPTAGMLYVVATPIGNLGDLSMRARQVLAEVDVIAAEDTRHTAGPLAHIGVTKPLISLHEHNEAQRVQMVLERIAAGERIALVSDAGTPLVSDPGFHLVRAVLAAGVQVTPIPGPCAAIAALSVAGLPTDRFVFEGFLPTKAGQRQQRLRELLTETRTLIFYEAPHRIAGVLADLAQAFGGERPAMIGRELTKQFESLYYGTLADLAARAQGDADMQRGEIVLLVAGAPVAEEQPRVDAEQVLRILIEELPASQAAKLAARITGAKRNELYARATQLASDKEA